MATAAAAKEDKEEQPATRFAKDHLKAFVERVERLEEEKKTIADDIRDESDAALTSVRPSSNRMCHKNSDGGARFPARAATGDRGRVIPLAILFTLSHSALNYLAKNNDKRDAKQTM